MPVAVFCLFLVFQEISTKWSPNTMKLFDDFFWTKKTLEASEGGQKPHEEVTRQQGVAPGRARPDALWAPHGSF